MSNWSPDSAHSQVEFAARHMMVTTVRGRFDRFGADVTFDEERPERSSVEVHIDAASIDTGEPNRDAHLRSPDFFDVAQFPELVFKSTRIEPKRGQSYRLEGELTIKGQTRPVVLDAEIEGIVANLQGGRRAAFTASTRISRKDWDLTWNVALESGGWLVGDEIRISIDLALVDAPAEAKREAEAEESPSPQSVQA